MGQHQMGGGERIPGEQEMGVAELQEWYKKFVVECPSGTLFMHEFKRFFGVQDNDEAAEYLENMFRAFDKNGVCTRTPPGPPIVLRFGARPRAPDRKSVV